MEARAQFESQLGVSNLSTTFIRQNIHSLADSCHLFIYIQQFEPFRGSGSADFVNYYNTHTHIRPSALNNLDPIQASNAMDYWMRMTRLTCCGSWCWYVVVAVALAGAGWLADASSLDDFRYFPNGMCRFSYIQDELSIIFFFPYVTLLSPPPPQ